MVREKLVAVRFTVSPTVALTFTNVYPRTAAVDVRVVIVFTVLLIEVMLMLCVLVGVVIAELDVVMVVFPVVLDISLLFEDVTVAVDEVDIFVVIEVSVLDVFTASDDVTVF